ncbi:BREX system P-loop protein BrxC [Burkholderia cenocepacia]|uniref:BREX system P-loop protein BrxC n=1 Tax=Burkholderia cenocepacia TaxID=95486 RepID=A0ABD4UNB6_9BURK|nr:BREX system P-loop protein BrxC [Burkholderia cenocepacia]MCW3699884.1 BREX system P-loop protein BrxC [Burkholderia cenocepacia]MCW3715817.1 BREX system P-loop protein BrxC [Burkholderia cenocepacia]MCW3723869.1 BREX system P-loop protein BrxC [Burkholderia cenocepacia]MCW3733257.1 BREX system P-loop protein BrxC [Burkholderia cenocepacia]
MMTTHTPIKTLFANDIHRRIEEVIKVDQTDEEIIRDEINEYVVTDAIRSHYTGIFDAYSETPNKPHEGIAIWVSGFFGSGKSSFAKMLGLSVANRNVAGESAAERFAERAGDMKLSVLLKAINENIPTHAVIFDVSTDRGIRSGNQTLTEIMYGLFLQSLGYAKDLDLSELEIGLEEKGQLDRFEEEYKQLFKKDWTAEKGKVAFALSEASRVLHSLDPDTYPMADSWVKAVKNKADITPGKLAERAGELMKRRKPGRSLMFVVDEVGQFVARDVQKMLDLQAIVQSLGVKGRGKHWVVVTSQEKLGELVSGLDDKKIELARLMDRFPLQVHLEPSDISEVTSRRVLSKNAAAQTALGKLFDGYRGRLTEHTRLTADVKLPELSREAFIDLYPLLPFQIDLIIQVVSGLRTQGGGSKHVGGANRTIIKLAQQLLINPAVNLADRRLGDLVRLDHVYDLVEGNIGSEVRAKIAAISKELNHPLSQPVAKVICLLQYVKSVHRSAENIAAALHQSVDGDSQLASVKEALQELVATHKVRQGDDGYRIPTPAEDDWERLRNGISPKPGDSHRLYSEVLSAFWQPQPSHTLFDTKTFKAGLAIHGREVTGGDMLFQVHLAEDGKDFDALADELRTRSQQERKHVFWAIGLTDTIDRETVELFRSKEMLARKERETRGEDTPALIAEERVRLRRHSDELRRLLRAACLSGRIYFRGNDRSPSDRAVDVSKTAAEVLGQVLPEVFDRFKEAAAKAADVKKGTDALFTAENLQGLPSVFGSIGLLRDEKGKTVFRTESGALKEVLDRIEERANYGDTASGRYLTDEFAKEPFGWDFEVVRLLVLSLLRAGKVEATSKGQTLDTVTGVEARETFSNNNLFRQASFRPKKGVEFEELVKASEAFRDTFGSEVKELNAGAIVSELRKEIARNEDSVSAALATLNSQRLPGQVMLDDAIGQMKAILRGSEDNAIATFNTSHRAIKDAVKRAVELEQMLTEPRLHDLERARKAQGALWSFLSQESDIADELCTRASSLEDLLERETFFKELPSIEQHTKAIETEYSRRFDKAINARVDAYSKAFDKLVKVPGWTEIDEDQRRRIAEPFERGQKRDPEGIPIPQLRADRDACEGRLRAATAELRRIIDGERVVTVSVGSYFAEGIETEEQLKAALDGIREECSRLIGAGKKIIVQ